jgi:glycosyltransferase involved in cell wall biosynthesis
MAGRIAIMSGAEPKVSVVIPTYNRARFLPEALESVFAQSYPNIEVVLADDGSIDDTCNVIRPYLNRIVYVKKANGGLASARNVGLRHASGKYIAIMDSDDICMPDRIATQVGYLERNPNVFLCSSDFSAFDGTKITETSHIRSYYSAVKRVPEGVRGLYQERHAVDSREIPWLSNVEHNELDIYVGDVYDALIWGNFIHPPTIMVRQAVVEKVGEFDEGMSVATDYDWILRVSRHGKAAFIDRPLLKYRYSDDQMSSDRHLAKIGYETIMVLEKLLSEDPEILERHANRFKARVGICYLAVSDALSRSDRTGALASLARSTRHGVINLTTLKVLAKIVVPRALVRRL